MVECAKIKMSKMLLKCLGVALFGGSLVMLIVQAGPTLRQQRVIELDPLMALPSDQHTPQEVPYVTYQQVVAPQYRPGAGQKQEVIVEYEPQEQPQQAHFVYKQEQPTAPYQLIQVSAQQQQQQQQQQQPQHTTQTTSGVHVHATGGPDCHQRHEYTSILNLENVPGPQVAGDQHQAHYLPSGEASNERPRGEYPGEIIYVDQQQQLSGLENVANSLARNSDVTATILTEIPIRDMPHEVLSKLKREYGVKVVATRDRPGANLVINCDDYPNQEGSVCGRQVQQQPHPSTHVEHRQQQQQRAHFGYLAGAEPTGHTFELPAEHHHRRTAFHIEHEVQPTSEPANVYVGAPDSSPGPSAQSDLTELAYPQPALAEAHEAPATVNAVEGQQQPNNESTNYGTRTNVAANGGDQQTGGEAHETTQVAPVETGQQENLSATSEQYQPGAGPDSVDQHAGFDEQPKSNGP